LDSTIRALRDNGLLAVTATDLAPLCGVHPKACVRKYGGKPLRTEYCHELAVRLLAGCVATLAAKHDVGVRMVFSHSSDHYVRLYAEIGYGAKKADESVKTLGYILHCFNCLHREAAALPLVSIEKCPECGSKMDYAGPLWLGTILDKQFCESMTEENTRRAFRNSVRISKLLSLARDEAEAPLTYYVIDKISSKLSSRVPSVDAVQTALRRNGFQAYPTHFNSRGVRTTASAMTMQKLLSDLGKL
jgi:tRNA (guanine26-N2/guanine27-N2)-dimethyltransferase